MRPKFKPGSYLIAGTLCLENQDSPSDVRLFGKYGWLWELKRGKFYAATFTNPYAMERVAAAPGRPLEEGDTFTFSFRAKLLPEVLRALQIPNTSERQLLWQQGFSARGLAKVGRCNSAKAEEKITAI